jgi:hypothetical protein
MVHVPGHLLSVSPVAMRAIPGLLAMNERVVMGGTVRVYPYPSSLCIPLLLPMDFSFIGFDSTRLSRLERVLMEQQQTRLISYTRFSQWPHGVFSMSAVGAYNVGGIRIHGAEALSTNHRDHDRTLLTAAVVPDACVPQHTTHNSILNTHVHVHVRKIDPNGF